MERTIPIYFDNVSVVSPFQGISDTNPNLGRLKVRVFTKYANRNGSYITDAVADQLIQSATSGMTPIVGFFDPETQTWASHTGPTLANSYGYVEDFLGWEKYLDTDNVEREYAVFSVVLFINYYEEAKKILGQNQSMELDPASIEGDWALIGDQELFVYTKAKMLGFCIIGSHEPCFSVSAFFSKNDQNYATQYDKFSSLLSDIKAQVEETKNKGGEQPMENFENQEQIVEENSQEVETEAPAADENFSAAEENNEDNAVEENIASEETIAPENFEEDEQPAETVEETVVEETVEENDNKVDIEKLQNDFSALQEQYNAAQERIAELEAKVSELTTHAETLQAENNQYAAIATNLENQRKDELIDRYEKLLSDDEIAPIRNAIKDFSYDELEGKLAITFANQKMASSEEEKKVPLLEPEDSFALLMKKYKK